MTLITHKFEEIYADLWRSYNLLLLLRKIYVSLFFDELIYKSWISLLQSKDEFFDIFKLWLPRTEICEEKLRCIQTDSRGEFISAALKNFCKKKSIIISYMAPYMYDENKIAKPYWRTLATMKDSLLIDSNLLVNFWVEIMDTTNYLCNQFLTRRSRPIFILKEVLMSIRQNLKYLQIFRNSVSTLIPNKKCTKLDMQKT